MRKTPRLAQSPLTGTWYIVTAYDELPDGVIVARSKHPLHPDDMARVADLLRDTWQRGYTSGHSNAMRKMSDEPDAPTTPNPYDDRAQERPAT